jgi:hypothetical protein
MKFMSFGYVPHSNMLRVTFHRGMELKLFGSSFELGQVMLLVHLCLLVFRSRELYNKNLNRYCYGYLLPPRHKCEAELDDGNNYFM